MEMTCAHWRAGLDPLDLFLFLRSANEVLEHQEELQEGNLEACKEERCKKEYIPDVWELWLQGRQAALTKWLFMLIQHILRVLHRCSYISSSMLMATNPEQMHSCSPTCGGWHSSCLLLLQLWMAEITFLYPCFSATTALCLLSGLLTSCFNFLTFPYSPNDNLDE